MSVHILGCHFQVEYGLDGTIMVEEWEPGYIAGAAGLVQISEVEICLVEVVVQPIERYLLGKFAKTFCFLLH